MAFPELEYDIYKRKQKKIIDSWPYKKKKKNHHFTVIFPDFMRFLRILKDRRHTIKMLKIASVNDELCE